MPDYPRLGTIERNWHSILQSTWVKPQFRFTKEQVSIGKASAERTGTAWERVRERDRRICPMEQYRQYSRPADPRIRKAVNLHLQLGTFEPLGNVLEIQIHLALAESRTDDCP